uniref:Uncharacterized protein n=1 Tax=Graphocephala atropunctata TaxID=36148 RepID=A0A1B6KB72_9HEMI
MLGMGATLGLASYFRDVILWSTKGRRGVGADPPLGPGSSGRQHHQAQLDAAIVYAPVVDTQHSESRLPRGAWWGPITTPIFPLAGRWALRPDDVVSRFQPLRNLPLEVRLRPHGLNGQQNSVQIGTRDVGTRRCVETQTRASDTNQRQINYQYSRDNVTFAFFRTHAGWIHVSRWVDAAGPGDADDDID